MLAVLLATSWVNANPGWIALIAAGLTAGITAAVTIVYVVLTWKLVGIDREATKASRESNRLAQEALDNDRRQYALAVRNQQDAAMPAVVIRFTGLSMNMRGSTPQESFGIGTPSRDAFNRMPLAINGSFRVNNHGPGPALLGVEVVSIFDSHITESPSELYDLAREPMVLKPDATDVTIGVSVWTDGHIVFDRIIGNEYAWVTFRWSAYAQPDTHDVARFSLRLADEHLESETVDQSFIGRVIAQPLVLLVPGDRTYPSLPTGTGND